MKSYFTYLIIVVLALLLSCEKEVAINLPSVEARLVVEGKIDLNANPIIILSKTTGYFDPSDLNSVAETFIDDATITISNGTTTSVMTKICSGSLSPPLQQALADQLGISVAILQNHNICGYTDAMIGEEGKSYTISINWEGENYNSTTKIPALVPLDSVWFEVQGTLDSLGYTWALLSDPPQRGNAYRWFYKRINKYTYGFANGEQKDLNFMAPPSSVFEDEFFNGLTFDFAYNRSGDNKNIDDDFGVESGYFKKGDTVIVKFCTIDKGVYKFINESEIQVASAGSPFAAPSNVTSNISNGALGLWAGYGVTFDTIIAN